VLGDADVLERAPGRWSPSRLGSPPRWVLAVAAVLVLAGGVSAFVAGGRGPGHASRSGQVTAPVAVLPSRVHAPGAVLPTACTYFIDPIRGAARPHGRYVPRQDAGCAPPRTAQDAPGGSQPGSSTICVALHVETGHPASQFGVRHRCYPGLT
jgi:hypothetical protein